VALEEDDTNRFKITKEAGEGKAMM